MFVHVLFALVVDALHGFWGRVSCRVDGDAPWALLHHNASFSKRPGFPGGPSSGHTSVGVVRELSACGAPMQRHSFHYHILNPPVLPPLFNDLLDLASWEELYLWRHRT